MKSRGFTLIELLAVIVILAAISIVVIPMIMGTINTARQNSIKSSALNYVNAVDEYVAVEHAKGNYIEDNESYSINDSPLSNVEVVGQKPLSGTVTIKNSQVTGFDLIMGTYEVKRTGTDGEIAVTEAGYVPTQYIDSLLNGADPVLDNGMIPVTISNNGIVIKADIYKEWYNYTKKVWANAVLVTNDVRDAYKNAVAGTSIDTSKILAYLVWIPRYKYKLFNATGVKTIDVVFEKNSIAKSNGTAEGDYVTHPAFTFGTTELNGIWVGKFELTGDTTTPTVLPNVTSLRSQSVATFFSTIAKIKSDTYGLASGSHMIMNKEWGAVAYLASSIYGNSSEIRVNNYTSTGAFDGNTLTGCGASVANGGLSKTCQNAYGTVTDYPQSTTGNINGIFDMSGGAWEYVMGTYNSTIGSSGFSTLPDSKYYQTYTTEANSPLGDATKETHGWNSDTVGFVTSSNTWFVRGGRGNGAASAGIFAFSSTNGASYNGRTSRVVIVP